MRRSFFLAALTILLTITPAMGDGCTPTTSQPEVDTGEIPDPFSGGTMRMYVDNDDCQAELLDDNFFGGSGEHDGCLFSIWIYQETNGVDGLQRNDEVKDDTCGGQVESDTFPS